MPFTCPPTLHDQPLARNAWPEARRVMAPAGAVTMRLCRYSGLNGSLPPGTLVRTRRLTDRALVTQLIREFDALRSPPPGTAFACPSDDGSLILALLTYPRGQRVTIKVQRTGCQVVSNGNVGALANGYGTPVGRRLEAQLAALTA